MDTCTLFPTKSALAVGAGDILKVLWFDGQGLMLLAKRLEPPAQLSMLLEGIDWRMPARTDFGTHQPELAA